MKTSHRTQELIVLDIIKRKGYVSRNDCLSRYISRLGAIIYRLVGRGQIKVTSRGYVEGDYHYVAKIIKKK